MLNRITTVALVACVIVPLSVSAEGLNPPSTQSPTKATNLSELFHKLGLGLISTAQAQQQCRDESETCTSDAPCCPGLECVGGPPGACREKD